MSAPDYENPTDSDNNNSYIVEVMVSDNGTPSMSDSQIITVNITDVNENTNNPPVITSNGGGPTATINLAENQTAVTTVTATDPDVGDILTYSISSGADQGRFSINQNSGALSFVTAPDYENPTDSDNNNSYIVEITVADNGTPSMSDSQIITVNILNLLNIAPGHSGKPQSVIKKRKNRYVCKDSRALNFSPYGKHDDRVCLYPWGWGEKKDENGLNMVDTKMKEKICNSNMLLVQKLKPGDKDNTLNSDGILITEVAILQEYLTRIGLDPGPVDGSYGEKVKIAVMQMQKNLGLEETGEIDDATIDAVFNSCD